MLRSGAGQARFAVWAVAPHGQTRRPGSGRVGHLRLEAPSALRTAAILAQLRLLGPVVLPCCLCEAPLEGRFRCVLTMQAERSAEASLLSAFSSRAVKRSVGSGFLVPPQLGSPAPSA